MKVEKECCLFEEVEETPSDGFNEKEDYSVSEKDIRVGEELVKFFSEIVKTEVGNEPISEQFVSKACLKRHYDDHCIAAHTNRVSKRTDVYYDFKDINKYRLYEDSVANKIKNTKYVVSSLFDVPLCKKYFRKLFEGGVSIRFSPSCDISGSQGVVSLGLHSFATDHTTNYSNGNTIDLSIIALNGRTISMYPLDAHYLESKINNIFQTHYASSSGNTGIPPIYKINND